MISQLHLAGRSAAGFQSKQQPVLRQTNLQVLHSRIKFGNAGQDDNKSLIEALKASVEQLTQQVKEMGETSLAVLKRLAVVENRTDIPKVAALVAPATVSVLMENSIGSGFWIKCKDGKNRIITNAHVVLRPVILEDWDGYRRRGLQLEKSSKIALYTASDDVKAATLTGAIAKPLKGNDKFAVARDYDLAVIEPADPNFKLPAGIKPLEIEDFNTHKPKVGDLVFKVGTGAKLPGTISMGIVSRLERKGPNELPSIQTDTPINPGDSGGPLVNMDGKLVGVNNSKLQGVEGVGFSIPAPYVKELLQEWGFID